MKNLMVLVIFIFCSYPLVAQQETLFSGSIESGGYGGPLLQIGQLDGETAIFIGGQGGWLINQTFGLGGKGYAMANRFEVGELENIKMEFACWGGLLEYIFSSNRLIHLNINSMIGAGSLRYAVIDNQVPHSDVAHSEDAFFVMEPGINVVLNVNTYFRISAGATYRYVDGINREGLSNADLSGLSVQVGLKFGTF